MGVFKKNNKPTNESEKSEKNSKVKKIVEVLKFNKIIEFSKKGLNRFLSFLVAFYKRKVCDWLRNFLL